MEYPVCWDLECFFSGGSSSKSLLQEFERLAVEIPSLEMQKGRGDFLPLLEKMQEVEASLRQCSAFILCLQSQNIDDDQANQLRAAFDALEGQFELFNNGFDADLIGMDPSSFQTLIENPQLRQIRFVIEERRARAQQKLSCQMENIITALSIDGYRGWGELYPQLVGEIKIPFESSSLSFGQAENKMTHPDRGVRKQVFNNLETAWGSKAPLFAQVLNRIAGFRSRTYAMRKWDDPLQEPLFENRMSKGTLDAMWNAVESFKGPLLQFMQAKAKVLGLEKLAWYDVEAPLFAASSQTIPYAAAVESIIEGFTKFHPQMGEFARIACTEKWIDAEDRPGKRPGGYCTSFPKSRSSRIFMTYSGTMVNVSTLAHELGHAYHTAMLDDLPSFAQSYRMNVAETASTFAEQIISDALLQNAKTQEEKLKILSDRIQRSIAFMMNIHARYLFEVEFYQRRKTQTLSADDLCSLMEQAQKTAYCNALSEWHPYFWAAKLHFYFTDVPFYNFPYTFGFLFSLGIYNLAKKRGAEFAKTYDLLLRESGMMSVENLAQKHLGVDLTQAEFWKQACSAAVSDVDLFLQMSRC